MIIEQTGLSAWIADSEGTPLPEYKVRKTDDQTIGCWIPSSQGTNFKIQWKALENPQPGLDLRCISWIDGIELYGEIQISERVAKGSVREKSSEVIGSSEARLLEFGKRELTDKDDVHLDNTLLDDLNTIRLKLEWGRSTKSAPRTSFREFKDIGPIHERAAKKGHAGSAQLGRTITAPTPGACHFFPDRKLKPVVFVFRYASRDWLQAREIIPSSPKPELISPQGGQKHARSSSLEIIDIDDLETDDEITIVKHMVPAPIPPSKKKRRMKNEDDAKPKIES